MSTSYSEVAKHQLPRGNPVDERWLGAGQFVGKRWVRTAWADRYNMIDELGQQNYGAGELWPYNTATGAYLYAARCVGSGRAQFDATGIASYDSALIELHYSTIAPVVFGGGYVISESIEPQREHKSFLGTGLVWDNPTGDDIGAEILTHIDCRMVYVLAFHNIQAAPTAALAYVGSCNHAAIPTMTLGVTFDKTTLLYSDPYMMRTIRPGFSPRLTLRYRWPFYPNGCNKKWDRKTGTYRNVYNPTTGNQVFFHPLRNFYNLYP